MYNQHLRGMAGRLPSLLHLSLLPSGRDLSPRGPLRLPIAISSGHPQFEQCHTPSIKLACWPSANSFSFASRSRSLASVANVLILVKLFGAALRVGLGASSRTEGTATVEGVGADTWARGLRTVGGYEGALNNPFGFFSLTVCVG